MGESSVAKSDSELWNFRSMWSSSALCPVCLADPEQCLCRSRTSSLRFLKPLYECTDQGIYFSRMLPCCKMLQVFSFQLRCDWIISASFRPSSSVRRNLFNLGMAVASFSESDPVMKLFSKFGVEELACTEPWPQPHPTPLSQAGISLASQNLSPVIGARLWWGQMGAKSRASSLNACLGLVVLCSSLVCICQTL